MSVDSDNRPFVCQLLGTREAQEDSYCIKQITIANKQAWLMAVADGMGGHAGGKQASELAIKAITDSSDQWIGSIQDTMKTILVTANHAIRQHITNNVSLKGMGCTFLVVICINTELYWLSVGDSILYVLQDSELSRINDDHSMTPVLEGLLELGRINQEEFKHDPRRHQLRSLLNGATIKMIDVCDKPLRLQQDNIVLVASDGIDSLPRTELISLLSRYREDSNKKICSEVINEISKRKGLNQDNATLIVFK